MFSIEPEPGNFEILKKNIIINSLTQKVFPINNAVDDKKGFVHFAGTGGTASVSSTGVRIISKPLDMILDELGKPDITIMKMDIE